MIQDVAIELPSTGVDSDVSHDGAVANPPPALSLALYWMIGLTVSSIGGMICQDWIGMVALLMLFAFWRLLAPQEGPAVLSMAFTYQWAQVTIGVFYYGITGRYSPTIYLSDYRPMVLIGLGAVASLYGGIALAIRFQEFVNPSLPKGPRIGLSDRTLAIVYLFTLISSGAILEWGGHYPGLYQGATVLGYFRYAFLFLIFRRFTRPRVKWLFLLPFLGFEVLLGFTGFFADFREPIIFAMLALFEILDARNIRHWLAIASSLVIAGALAITWTAIKPEYRAAYTTVGTRSERLSFINILTRRLVSNGTEVFLESFDATVDRLWVVYYPALAVERVPSVIPHTGGKMMWEGLRSTITPRLFFPNKPPLIHDSEKVRTYSGMNVAGENEGVSIAFGYAVEMYVDFGVPGMFYPILIVGFIYGFAFRRIYRLIRYRDVAVSVAAVIIWICIYQFEQSWAHMLGYSLSTILYLTAAAVGIDRFIAFKQRTARALGRA